VCLVVPCSSVIQIPGESTLRRNFQQIQEGEGRRTPNPLSSRRVAPPANELVRQDYSHGGPRGNRPRQTEDHALRPHDDRRHADDRQAHGRDDRPVRHRGDVRQPGSDGFQRHPDHVPVIGHQHQHREPVANHRRSVQQPANHNGQPVRPSPPRTDNDSRCVVICLLFNDRIMYVFFFIFCWHSYCLCLLYCLFRVSVTHRCNHA